MPPPVTKKCSIRRTAYSVFCMEKALEEEFKNMQPHEKLRQFGIGWKALSASDRERYKEKAASDSTPADLSWRKKRWQKVAQKMYSMLSELQQLLPTEGFLVLSPAGGEPQTYGTPLGAQFLAQYGGPTTAAFTTFLKGACLDGTYSPKPKVTAKVIQNIFNTKYSDVRGLQGLKFPYKGNVRMEGMPLGIPFRHPSKYGQRQIRAIYEARNNLRCVITSTGQCDALHSTLRPDVATSSPPPEGLVSMCDPGATWTTLQPASPDLPLDRSTPPMSPLYRLTQTFPPLNTSAPTIPPLTTSTAPFPPMVTTTPHFLPLDTSITPILPLDTSNMITRVSLVA